MNKKSFRIWNVAKWRRGMVRLLAMGRTFALLVISSVLFFVLLGFGGMAEQKLQSSPVSSMKGFASSLSSRFFMDMLGMEIPHLSKKGAESAELSGEQMTTFVFQLLTSINPRDPKSLIAKEMPGMGYNNPVLLRSASGNTEVQAPEDYHPGADHAAAEGDGGQEPEPDLPGAEELPPLEEPESPVDEGEAAPLGHKNEILIYHSHPREAFNPLLSEPSSNPNSASPEENIMLVGKLMADQLEAKGVKTLHIQKDYATEVKDYNWNYSYKYSRQTVMEALAQNSQLTYLLDIHRDSQKHDKTTTVIDGLSYSQVYFIIGHENKHWRQNEAFASAIHERLERDYPGISRGVWGKTASQGNGEYNQSLSPNSIVIEIGGIDSTREELERTSKVLADIVADLYFEDQEAQKAGSFSRIESTEEGVKG